MKRRMRIRLLLLMGILVILFVSLRAGHLFNTSNNFHQCQLQSRQTPNQEVIYNNAAYRRAGAVNIYVLSVEWDLRFYPAKYVVISTHQTRVVIELIFGPGPENVIQLDGQEAEAYLLSMKLHLLR